MPGQQITAGAEEEKAWLSAKRRRGHGAPLAHRRHHRPSILLGGAYLFVAKPVYKADGLLQVEEKGGGGMSAALMTSSPCWATAPPRVCRAGDPHLPHGARPHQPPQARHRSPAQDLPHHRRRHRRRYQGHRAQQPAVWPVDSYAWGRRNPCRDALTCPAAPKTSR